jgi:hypothetical protein
MFGGMAVTQKSKQKTELLSSCWALDRTESPVWMPGEVQEGERPPGVDTDLGSRHAQKQVVVATFLLLT